jgi:low temperature requirement protein LtrA
MRNRWFHAPRLHSPAAGAERKVGWLELFFDLIFVATLIQLGNALSENLDARGLVLFCGLFVPVWWAWSGFTFFSNRFDVDDLAHRLTVFAMIGAVGAMALFAPRVFAGETRPFALAYAFCRGLLVVLYLRTARQADRGQELSRGFAAGFGVGVAFWLASAFVDPPWTYLLWALGMTIELAVPVSPRARELAQRFPPDAAHMTERYGLFTLIVLGESFVKLLTALSEKALEPHLELQALLGLAIAASLWWTYFDDVASSPLKRRPFARWVWLYSHLPLAVAITATAVGIKKIALLDPGAVAPAPYRWLLGGSLAVALASVAAIDAVTERPEADLDDRIRVRTRLASAGLLVLLVLVGASFPANVLLALVAAVCAAQVALDLAMAPLAEATDHAARQAALGHGEPAPRAERRRRPPDLAEAVRLGTPNALRRDLYSYFMEGSWYRLLTAAAALYALINFVFASLYVMRPGSIDGARPESFLDAFFFSVQTVATIGYGAMTPVTTYGHTLVVLQAFTALLVTAVLTGLVFAKAARPTASVLWSDVLTVGHFDGQPALMLRLGNARGHEIVEATIRLAAVCDRLTAEGTPMRRLYDLDLVRSHSPLFALSWTVVHVLDERSPFHGIDETNAAERFQLLIASMSGHDGTYAQTVHSRRTWTAEDLRFGQRFVDVITTLPDGRLRIDYGRFHEVEPDRPADGRR